MPQIRGKIWQLAYRFLRPAWLLGSTLRSRRPVVQLRRYSIDAPVSDCHHATSWYSVLGSEELGQARNRLRVRSSILVRQFSNASMLVQ